MNLLMGSESQPSLIGVEKCTVQYYSIQMMFVFICVASAYIAVNVNKREQRLKIKYHLCRSGTAMLWSPPGLDVGASG